MITKKKILFLSFILTGPYLTLVFLHDTLYDFCIEQGHCWRFWDSLDIIGPILFLWPIALLFSLLTYKMHEKVFRAWIHFAYWWVPLSIILTFLAGGGSGGGFGIPNVFDREFVAFIFSALFFIISLIIIVWKYVATRRSTAE